MTGRSPGEGAASGSCVSVVDSNGAPETDTAAATPDGSGRSLLPCIQARCHAVVPPADGPLAMMARGSMRRFSAWSTIQATAATASW
jgi:hypothetical protein